MPRLYLNDIFLLKVDGCHNYENLTGPDRAQGYLLQNYSWRCDLDLTTGWYRFQGAAGDQIADKCLLMWRCGTRYSGWLNGSHPSVAEGVVARNVCYSDYNDCCKWSNNIKVKNCSGYYVYELQKPPLGYTKCLRYCGNAGTGKLDLIPFSSLP